MVFLTWSLAKNVRFKDKRLHDAIRQTLLQSIRISIQTLEFAKSKGVKIKFHGRKKTEPAHYCGFCDEEVFNVLFVRENEKKHHVVHCLRCAMSVDSNLKGFVCLEEYNLTDLLATYDKFVFSGS